MRPIYIIGAGGFAREVAWLIERINLTEKTWEIKGFLDDDTSIQGTMINGYPVKGSIEYINQIEEDVWVANAVGSSKTRELINARVSNPKVSFATLIDPSVYISNTNTIGEGTIICAGTIVTVNTKIGKHVIVNLDCTIGHDAIISDYVTVYPSVNISGLVSAEPGVEIGTGTQIIQGKKIGKSSIIGAGAVIVKDIPKNCTAVGSPAKPIKFHD